MRVDARKAYTCAHLPTVAGAGTGSGESTSARARRFVARMTKHTGIGRIGARARLSALVALPVAMWVAPAAASPETSVEKSAAARSPWIGAGADVGPVSYTHLTLPTSDP